MKKKQSENSISWLCQYCALYRDAECSGEPNACEDYENYDVYPEMFS